MIKNIDVMIAKIMIDCETQHQQENLCLGWPLFNLW